MSVAEIQLKLLAPEQIPAVIALEQAATEFPWTQKMYIDSLAAGYWGGGLWQGPRLVGAAVVSTGVGEAHLLNMCVALEHQGQGYGRMLLAGACQQAGDEGARKMFLEVRAGNGRALSLYQSVGFRQIGVRKNYYPGALGREDAVCMALNLCQ
ncbi:MAG: ribosomal-protein-alanine N-acetyltransferase [Gammaproteobacteria bacterium]|nr:ribosomal-protein-alanine N-acetyltransferase [Gammaproteobacteria bacterium]